MAPALDEALLLERVEQLDHRGAVDLESVAERPLGHRLALGDQRENPHLAGSEADLAEHLVGERVGRLRCPVEGSRGIALSSRPGPAGAI